MRISDWSSDVCSSDLVIGPRVAGLHREMAAVVAGDADLRRGAEQRARLARVAIVLPEMDAVGAEPFGEAAAVVDDERPGARAADFQERLGKARRLMQIGSAPVRARLVSQFKLWCAPY